jgi:hypothetical protein
MSPRASYLVLFGAIMVGYGSIILVLVGWL